MEGLLEYATHEQASKSVTKALKEGGKEVVDKVVKKMCEPAKGYVLFMCPADPTYWSSSIGHLIPFDVGLSGADGVGQINLRFSICADAASIL